MYCSCLLYNYLCLLTYYTLLFIILYENNNLITDLLGNNIKSNHLVE